jgi:excisionase family DNA binding protein
MTTYTTDEAVKTLGISRSTLKRLAADNVIEIVQPGGVGFGKQTQYTGESVENYGRLQKAKSLLDIATPEAVAKVLRVLGG